MRLSVQGVEFGYKSVPVLEDVGFSAEVGEVVGVLGPNGSGKTTLLKCMNKTLKPRAGSVLIDDRDISVLPRREIAKEMGVVPQNSGVNFPFTALEIVMMGRLMVMVSCSVVVGGRLMVMLTRWMLQYLCHFTLTPP